VRIESVTRHDFAHALAPKPAVRDVAPEPRPTDLPRYDEFVATQASERAIDRPTYSDVLDARREALRRAHEIANADAFHPLTFPGMQPPTDAPRAHEPCQPAWEIPPAPAPGSAAPAAKRNEFRRVVDTLDNRGSLIDLLL
jgi:hypothetical protein